MTPVSSYIGAAILLLVLNAVAVVGQSCVSSTPLSLILGTTYLSGCTVSTGTHSFTIDNPNGSGIRYFSTDGANCASIYNGGTAAGGTGTFYPAPFSNSVGTLSTNISVTNAPCTASPCCVVIGCADGLGCNLVLNTTWNPQGSSTTTTIVTVLNVGAIVGAVAGGILGITALSVVICRYRQVCCFKPKDILPTTTSMNPGFAAK